MNSDKQEKNQRLRIAQSSYRKNKHKHVKRDEESKTWTVIMIISVFIALFILIITELVFMDQGIPIPEFLSKFLTKLVQNI
jgi:uncharacterized Rmd1/YagE family protein